MMESDRVTETQLTEKRTQQFFGFWFLAFAGLILLTVGIRLAVIKLGLPIFYNDKFAFSLNVPTPVIYVFYVVAMVFISNYLYRHWLQINSFTKLALVLIVAGGVSNFMERLLFNKVVDYFFFANGVLNIADIFILIGIILLFIFRDRK